jgi:LPPG:FO 2-phospho-L-lactate transferase
VGRAHRDEVDAVEVEGASVAQPAPGVVEALTEANAILLAPSNPYLSIGPILAISEIRGALAGRAARCIAVSPLVGGASVTGPLGRMLSRMSGGTTPAHVADRYAGLVDALVIDEADAPATADVELVVTNALMWSREAARALAEVALEAACV